MLEILTTDLEGRRKWHELIKNSSEIVKDIHFLPEYLHIYEITYGVKALCIKKKINNGFIYQPLILRKIPNTRFSDLTSVYGYGGPIPSKNCELESKDLFKFENDFRIWANSINAISEYCLLHPLLGDYQKKLITRNTEVKFRKKIINIDLIPNLSYIWSRVEERQRKAILSARKKGIKIEKVVGNEADFLEFHRQYINTMEDVGATEFWYFPKSYFSNCFKCLGRKKVIILKAIDNDKVIASAIHLYSKNNLYYHFSCSIREERKKNAMPLLLFESILWAKSIGIKNFHMGGGTTEGEDDLFTFKRSFGGQEISSYFYCRKFNNEIYDKLSEERIISNLQEEVKVDKNYFPLYRA